MTVRWVVVASLLISFIDVIIKISIKLWKFTNIELVILKMEKKYIEKNYDIYRVDISKKQAIRDTTMQELLTGMGLESLNGIRVKLAERAVVSETKKKKKYIRKQLKEIDQKIEALKQDENAHLVLAEICAEKAVNGKELVEQGVDMLTAFIPKADPKKVQAEEIKRQKKKKKKGEKSS